MTDGRDSAVSCASSGIWVGCSREEERPPSEAMPEMGSQSRVMIDQLPARVTDLESYEHPYELRLLDRHPSSTPRSRQAIGADAAMRQTRLPYPPLCAAHRLSQRLAASPGSDLGVQRGTLSQRNILLRATRAADTTYSRRGGDTATQGTRANRA